MSKEYIINETLEFYKYYAKIIIPSIDENSRNNLLHQFIINFDMFKYLKYIEFNKDVVYVFDQQNNETKFFRLTDNAFECFKFSFQNLICSNVQFEFFKEIINKYRDLKNDNELFKHKLYFNKYNKPYPIQPHLTVISEIGEENLKQN